MEILQEIGIPDHLTCLLRNVYTAQEATVRTGHGTTDLSKSGNVKANLTYMQTTLCEMPGWMNHKLESRLSGELLTISDLQMISL